MHLHSIEKHDFHMLKCKKVNIAPSLWLSCDLTLTILRPHFDYLAHRLRVFYTAFPGFFRSKKGNFTHPKNTSRYVSRCYTNHNNSSVRQRQPLPWFLRVSRRFENTIYCRFRAEEAKYQNVSYEQQNNDKASARNQLSAPGSLHKHCPHAGNVIHILTQISPVIKD